MKKPRVYKIGPVEVSQIKKLLSIGKYSQQRIANKFKLSRMTIHRIKTNQRWAHVKEDTSL